MGFSWSDLDPTKEFKEFFKDPFDYIGDVATDLYHGAEKIVKVSFRETFRLLGITGDNVLQGDISSQLLSKDIKASKNLLISEIIKKQNGNVTPQQYIMNLLVSGKLTFNKVYNYGSTKYSNGLPMYYIIDAIDAKEEDNALVIAQALEQSDESIVIDEVTTGRATHRDYKFSCLLAYYHYNPSTNTVKYSDKRLIVTDNITVISPGIDAYEDSIIKVIIKGAEYNTITYTADRSISTTIIPSIIPNKEEVTTTSVLTYYFFEEGVLFETRDIIENIAFSLMNAGTGTYIHSEETNVLSGSFEETPIEKFISVEKGEITVSIGGIYAYEEDGVTTYYSRVVTDVRKHFRVENHRTDAIVFPYVSWFSCISSTYYLQGEEPTLGTTEFEYPGIETVIGIKDIIDITQDFPGFGNYTYLYPAAMFDSNNYTYTDFIIIRFHKEESPDSIYTFCYNPSFDNLTRYRYIPTLSSLLSSYYTYQNPFTFPIIPLKRDSIWLDSYDDSFKKEVLDLMKAINITSDDLLDELKSNTESDNVTDVFLHFAVHPSEVNKNETVGRYLWVLLESIEDKVIPLPTDTDRYLGFTLQDERYNCSIIWKYTPTTNLVQSANFTYNVYVDDIENKGLIVQYYDGTKIYSKVMKNCSFTAYITRDNETVISEKTITDKGFHIPLIQEYINILTPYEQIEILSCSVSLSCFASEWVHLKYYQTTDFFAFITVVSLAVMVVTFGASVKESGLLIALAKTATQIAISYGLKRAVEYVYEQTDNDVVRVLATATAIVATVYAGHELFDIDIVSLTSLNSATDIIQASMEIDLQYKAEQLEKEQIKFSENYEKRMDTLEEMYESLETNLDPFSIMQINHSDTDWTPRLLSIDSYYSIALGNVDMDYNNRFMVDNNSYYENKLKIGSI